MLFSNMTDFFKKLVSNNSEYSSARVLTMAGGAVSGILLIADTIYNKNLNSNLLTIYLGYHGLQYTSSKYLDYKNNTLNATTAVTGNTITALDTISTDSN